jgi:hypothetical protein
MLYFPSDLIALAGQESAPEWRKSTASGMGADCVEVATWRSSVLVRDSRNKAGAVLKLTYGQWLGLLSLIKNQDAGRSRARSSLVPIRHLPASP